MNWSTITWAALTKSPNCASHSTSVSGDSWLIAVLEAEAADLRQRAVVQLERRRELGAGPHRADGLAVVRVVQDEVALAEGAALGVLAGEADRRALGEQRAVGERLGVRPVDRAASSAPRRRSIWRTSFGCTVKPAGTRRSCPSISRSSAASTLVSTSGEAVRSRWYSSVWRLVAAAVAQRGDLLLQLLVAARSAAPRRRRGPDRPRPA